MSDTDPDKMTMWLNIYLEGAVGIHYTLQQAQEACGNNRIARVCVSYKMGQYDEEPEDG